MGYQGSPRSLQTVDPPDLQVPWLLGGGRHGAAQPQVLLEVTAPGAAGAIGDALEQRVRFSLATKSILRCLADSKLLQRYCLLLMVFMTHISPPIKPFHIFTDLRRRPVNTSWKSLVSRRWDQSTLPKAATHPAQGIHRLCIPAPVARPQRSGELATSANSPASQRKHFLHSSLCTPQTLPPAQPNPLKGFKGQRVFAVRRGLTMLSLLTCRAGRQRWDHWATVCGVQAAPVGSTAPAEPRLCTAPHCCCWFSCPNFQQIRSSGWTGRTSLERPACLELGAVVQLHVTFT